MPSHIVNRVKKQRTMISKESANYVDHIEGHKTCDTCVMFHANRTCDKVRGSINPKGHCKFWEAKHG